LLSPVSRDSASNVYAMFVQSQNPIRSKGVLHCTRHIGRQRLNAGSSSSQLHKPNWAATTVQDRQKSARDNVTTRRVCALSGFWERSRAKSIPNLHFGHHFFDLSQPGSDAKKGSGLLVTVIEIVVANEATQTSADSDVQAASQLSFSVKSS
jgi:hypothetical protein